MSASEYKIVCRNLWKVFGIGVRQFMADRAGKPSDESLRQAGLLAAVKGVDLEVRAGQTLAIMGMPGSGKSTLIRCLSRLVEISAGQILLDGEDLASADELQMNEFRRRRMGMLSQGFTLPRHLSVLRNVSFPLEILGVEGGQRLARAKALIELVGLSGKEDFLPGQLADAERQRVGIARSLAVEPELWFLDQPFSRLDRSTRLQMQEEFLRLKDAVDTTIILATDDIEEAIRLADQLAIMKDGAVIQVDTPERILSRPANGDIAALLRQSPGTRKAEVA
ncbi:ATP-binding cassette domain-containing protein [Stappia sp. F7233]|uniref:ATP-binding cassette domain-containing protein n=1 Tax=Stappia albiluteola TaxID=2758565 RepID=A0A839ADJ5_9HYPH|nr:ATP-binding cassette domain-containing protein [Stappia albiluteola]MBA5777753.1 ATP-binding cassette domain-containing protein [Stappia albiluteola]